MIIVDASSAPGVTQYGGNAANLWADSPGAGTLIRRLEAFDGIGPKKAAMAVLIIERHLGIPIRLMAESDIAYDVHLRRVFLRSGIAEYDDREHMVARARQLNPARPGALDLGAWLVGRDYCRPQSPDCAGCPLTDVCRRDVTRAAHVRGG